MANLNFKKGLYENLPLSKVAGTVYITTDERAMYVDVSDTERIRIQGTVLYYDSLTQFTNEVKPPYSSDLIYFIANENALVRWDPNKKNADGETEAGWIQLNATVDNLNTVISKLKPGENETTDIPSNFTDNSTKYYSSRTEILKVISDTADAFAKAYVDDIKIGGVNLLYGSKNLIGRNGYQDFKISNYKESTVTKTIGVDRCYFEATDGTSKEKIFITLLPTDDSRFDITKEYTFSVDITNTDYSTIVFYIKLSKTY